MTQSQPAAATAQVRNTDSPDAFHLLRYSSEILGEYCAAPNHVQPTSQTARFSSPLGVRYFEKRSSLIDVCRQGAQSASGRSPRTSGLAARVTPARMRIE